MNKNHRKVRNAVSTYVQAQQAAADAQTKLKEAKLAEEKARNGLAQTLHAVFGDDAYVIYDGKIYNAYRSGDDLLQLGINPSRYRIVPKASEEMTVEVRDAQKTSDSK